MLFGTNKGNLIGFGLIYITTKNPDNFVANKQTYKTKTKPNKQKKGRKEGRKVGRKEDLYQYVRAWSNKLPGMYLMYYYYAATK